MKYNKKNRPRFFDILNSFMKKRSASVVPELVSSPNASELNDSSTSTSSSPNSIASPIKICSNILNIPGSMQIHSLSVGTSRDALYDKTSRFVYPNLPLHKNSSGKDRLHYLHKIDKAAYSNYVGNCHRPPKIIL